MWNTGHLNSHKDLPIEIFLIILTIIIVGALALPIWGLGVILFDALLILAPVLIAAALVYGIIKVVHYYRARHGMH